MKKVIISSFTILIVIALFTSCKKIIAKVFGGTDINVPEVQVTIPAVIALSPNELSLGTFSYNFNLDSIVKANTAGVFGANAVNSVKIKQAVINILNADQLNNFANFKTVRVTLQSNNNTTPVDIISAGFADTYATTFTYVPTNSPELISYLKGSNISYTVYGSLRRTTNKPLTLSLSLTLRAD